MSQKLAEQFSKPVLTGALAYMASMAYGNEGVVNVFGNRMDINVTYGLVGVANDFAGELVHNFVLPYIPKNGKFAKAESAMLLPALGAGGNLAFFYLINPNIIEQAGMIQPAVIGAGSVIGGQWIYDQFIHDMLK